MNTATKLLLSSAALFTAFAASAAPAMPGQDAYHQTNGGTGYIGLTESAGQARTMNTDKVWTASSQMVNRTPTAAGEASTMVNGRPNVNPDAPGSDSTSMRAPRTQSMGNAAARNPAWGTPD
ncbi:MAG: hypothetical protein V4787_08600 [Pseudomonadota bacterium]